MFKCDLDLVHENYFPTFSLLCNILRNVTIVSIIKFLSTSININFKVKVLFFNRYYYKMYFSSNNLFIIF